MEVSKVECAHCGALVDRLETKTKVLESTGERFIVCGKCAKNESIIY